MTNVRTKYSIQQWINTKTQKNSLVPATCNPFQFTRLVQSLDQVCTLICSNRKNFFTDNTATPHILSIWQLSHEKWRENLKFLKIRKRMNGTTHTFGIGRNGDLILDRCCPQYPVKRPSLPFHEISKKILKKIWTLWNVRLLGAIFIPKIVNFGQKFDQNYHFWSFLDESVKKHE